MSQVPNRYFNSPWIADAARNLSLAIAGDPERDAARLQQKQIEANMLRQQQADALILQDRARAESARNSLGQIVLGQEADIPALMSTAITQGADPNQVFSAAGTASPKYRQQTGLKEMQLSSALELAGMKNDFQRQLAELRDATTRRGQDMTSDTSRYSADRRYDSAVLSAATRRALAAAKGAGGTPLDISPQDQQAINDQVLILADNMGGTLDPQTVHKIVTDTATGYQQSRNIVTAMDAAVLKNLGENPTIQPGERSWGGIGPRGPSKIVPQPSAPAPMQSAPSGNLSDSIFMQLPGQSLFGAPLAPPQFGAPATAAPSQATPQLPVMNSPAEARAKLRPGDSFVTPDGRVMVLK